MRPSATLLAALAAVAVGCADVPARLGASRAEASARVAGVLAAAGDRFGPVEMEPDLEEFRPRLARYSFTPSQLFDDPAWVVAGASRRRIGFWGRREGARYRLGLAGEPPPLERVSDYRGELGLERLAEHEYQWTWLDELSLGPVPPDFVARLMGSVFLDAGSGVEDLGGWLRRSLPRTSVSLGRLVRLERLDPTLQPDGATHVGVGFVFEPERVADEFPAYARYLERFFEPIEMNIQVHDERGRRWWAFDQRRLRVNARFRVHGGRLAPLEAPPDRMPERLRVELDLSTKSGLFRVGFDDLWVDVRLVRTAEEKAFEALGRSTPRWRIPFMVKPLMRSALDRPFTEAGVRFDLGVRGGPDGLTRVELGFRFVVFESWLVRRMGSFVSSATNAFREEAEEEANRFQGQVLEAFRQDVEALLEAGGAPPPLVAAGEPGR